MLNRGPRKRLRASTSSEYARMLWWERSWVEVSQRSNSVFSCIKSAGCCVDEIMRTSSVIVMRTTSGWDPAAVRPGPYEAGQANDRVGAAAHRRGAGDVQAEVRFFRQRPCAEIRLREITTASTLYLGSTVPHRYRELRNSRPTASHPISASGMSLRW